MPPPTREFHFEMSGNLADFAALVAILRGEELDTAKLAKMSRDLHEASRALQQEIDQQTPPPPATT